jgi:hypothetical protein
MRLFDHARTSSFAEQRAAAAAADVREDATREY